MSSTLGKTVKVTAFGQSHSDAIGAVIEGLPAGIAVDLDELQRFLDRRAPGRTPWSTPRKEADVPRILGGLSNGRTCGAPFAAIIENTNTRSQDYDELRSVPRPGHADFTANIKFGGFQDVSGGGHFSARVTAGLCIAGGICKQALREKGVFIGAHVAEIDGISDRIFDGSETHDDLEILSDKQFPALDDSCAQAMIERIAQVRAEGDSVGGIVECAVLGAPAGLGSPMFDGVENRIAQACFGIPAVKGIEFGAGFAVSRLRGSQNNDPYRMVDGSPKPVTNNSGGILGGITTGEPVLFRVAIKPTPSISMAQDSVNLSNGQDCTLEVKGRHDPCVVPRAVPVVEAVAAIAFMDMLVESRTDLW